MRRDLKQDHPTLRHRRAQAESWQSVRVVRGPFALTWGAGTLSAIRAETFRPAFADGDFRINGRAGYNHGRNGSANDGFAGLWGSNGRIRFTFRHNTRSGGDYTDAEMGELSIDMLIEAQHAQRRRLCRRQR